MRPCCHSKKGGTEDKGRFSLLSLQNKDGSLATVSCNGNFWLAMVECSLDGFSLRQRR
jgi:hypothetical protein